MKTKKIIIEDYFTPWKRWFENRVIPSKDRIVVFIQDITERKLAEKIVKN
jgi:PAS domain-containing protein